jgi:hypothetical protein
VARWQSYQIRLYAVIGELQVDVTHFMCDFELNAIPRASMLLPAGRNVRTGAAAAIHSIADELKVSQPVTVFVEMIPGQGAGQGGVTVPKGSFKLFEGRTAGGNYERTTGGLYYRVGINHWLIDLTGSSTLSVNMHPANPGQFTFGALVTTSDSASWSGAAAADNITSASLRTDLWESIRLWLLDLASGNSLEGHTELSLSGSNNAAIAALNRMKPGKAPPLALDGGDVDDDIVRVISAEIANLASDPSHIGSSTFWDLLIGRLSSSFLFALVPRVDDALVVPYVPGFRTSFANIDSSHYGKLASESHIDHPIRAVCVLSGYESATRADGFIDKSLQYLGGVYPLDLGDANEAARTDSAANPGRIKIVEGPGWLQRILAPGLDARNSSPGPGVKVRTALNRASVADADGTGGRRNSLTEKAKSRKLFLDNYAHARFAMEMLQGRSCVLGGAVRFDIAPGSTIKIQGNSQLGIPGDKLGKDQYATVLRVSYTFDAEASLAGTSFHLGYIRNEEENKDDRTSIDDHPLYSESWGGAKLVE